MGEYSRLELWQRNIGCVGILAQSLHIIPEELVDHVKLILVLHHLVAALHVGITLKQVEEVVTVNEKHLILFKVDDKVWNRYISIIPGVKYTIASNTGIQAVEIINLVRKIADFGDNKLDKCYLIVEIERNIILKLLSSHKIVLMITETTIAYTPGSVIIWKNSTLSSRLRISIFFFGATVKKTI